MKRPKVNFTHTPKITLALLLSALYFLTGCAASEKPLAEAPPQPVVAPAEQTSQAPVAKLPPPQMNEVQDAVKRVFKESVILDTSNKQTYVVGDFNGDLSEDIAVVLRPASNKLAELNEEHPSWILRDLASRNQPRGPRLRVGADDELLAIIHGYEAMGWRDPQATQTYLLKNAAGRDLRAHPAKEFIAQNKGKKLPQLRGDLVGEELGGKSGYLYYAGATYSWYDPKTFAEEPVRRTVHMSPGVTKK